MEEPYRSGLYVSGSVFVIVDVKEMNCVFQSMMVTMTCTATRSKMSTACRPALVSSYLQLSHCLFDGMNSRLHKIQFHFLMMYAA